MRWTSLGVLAIVAAGVFGACSDDEEGGGKGGTAGAAGGKAGTAGAAGSTAGTSGTGGGGTGGGGTGGGGTGGAGTAGVGGDATAGGSLILSIDPSLDTDDGTVKADALTSADLLDKTGTSVATGTVAGGTATFDISTLTAGDYFIKVNGDADDLVPTRIDDATATVTQAVGQKLNRSAIGPAATPVYRIRTFSSGQGEHAVAKFSNGAPENGTYGYVIITVATRKLESKVLGTAAALTELSGTMDHPNPAVSFDAWVLMTMGEEHHGDSFMADGGAATCGTCHPNYGTKPATYAQVTTTNGHCFHCHYGTDGPPAGLVDPNQ